MKGKERHHLKEDELVHGMHGVFVFVKQWRRQIILAGILVAALGVAFAGFRFVRSRQAVGRSRVVSEILALRADLPKVPGNVAKLEALAAKGRNGRIASLSLATWWMEQGEVDKARAALSAVKDSPRDFTYYQAKHLQAEIALLKGDPDGALAILDKIIEEKPRDFILDAVLFRKAEALEKKSETKEALALYKKIQADYPQSYYGYDASQKVAKMEGGPGAGAPLNSGPDGL